LYPLGSYVVYLAKGACGANPTNGEGAFVAGRGGWIEELRKESEMVGLW
jgi:hypothetical protein